MLSLLFSLRYRSARPSALYDRWPRRAWETGTRAQHAKIASARRTGNKPRPSTTLRSRKRGPGRKNEDFLARIADFPVHSVFILLVSSSSCNIVHFAISAPERQAIGRFSFLPAPPGSPSLSLRTPSVQHQKKERHIVLFFAFHRHLTSLISATSASKNNDHKRPTGNAPRKPGTSVDGDRRAADA